MMTDKFKWTVEWNLVISAFKRVGALRYCFTGTIVLLVTTHSIAQRFTHPGILLGKTDIERMQVAVRLKQQPVFSGYEVFARDPASQFNYKMQGPLEMVGRNPTVGQSTYDNDANAAFQNAVMWAITGDKRYSEKSIALINAWSQTLKSITGRDAILMAGLGPFKMVNAAEIIRYTHAGWKEVDIKMTEKHFKEVVYPILKDYAPFANGNWDAAAMKTCLAIGVFCNDREIFEAALSYYTHGWGNGSLKNYIINAAGQIQESGRDQPHSQLGIGMLAECCAIAWNQGLDLYAYDDNRLLKGFEYVAKYNLNNDDMPFEEWLDRTGKYHHYKISDKGRGALRPLFEQVYAHYVVQQGMKAPYVEAVVKKLRPEGAGRPGADHPGYGTLFFAWVNDQPPLGERKSAKPAAPAGLVALGKSSAISLSWIKTIGRNNTYIIKRAKSLAGPFVQIAKNIAADTFVDRAVKNTEQYYYSIETVKDKQRSVDAFPRAAVAGLPKGWRQTDIGAIKTGISYYNGTQLCIDASGKGIGAITDALHFTYTGVTERGSLIVRILPQPSSQFSVIGIMLRADTTTGAPFVTLSLYPGKTGQPEEPDWHTRLESRTANGAETKLIAKGGNLTTQAATFGRLTGCFWLKLEKKGDEVAAYTSYDGNSWGNTGRTTIHIGATGLLGISVASGIQNSTKVRIDKLKSDGTVNL
ncbi:alginate lyase family protein [Niabella soli]|nr:alginate lyase family protein [Niabella soli]